MKDKSCIMAVDDDKATLCMVEETLAEYYDVMLALSGTHALDILNNSKKPDLILLDIDMPDMDGYETFKHICDMDMLSGIPVIFLTGMTGSEAELAVLSLGAQDYISKPFVRENLLARIDLRLKGGKQAKELKTLMERFRRSGIDEEKFVNFTRNLRPVEQEIAHMIVLGYNNQEIADRLNYSTGYVRNLIMLIYNTLGVHSRVELRLKIRS